LNENSTETLSKLSVIDLSSGLPSVEIITSTSEHRESDNEEHSSDESSAIKVTFGRRDRGQGGRVRAGVSGEASGVADILAETRVVAPAAASSVDAFVAGGVSFAISLA